MSTSAYSRIPAGLFFGTGAVVFFANAGLLVLQLVAGKLLAPFIGSSIETWTCVIGVFLTGIALGNWLGGRLADRFPSPRTVGVLLILGGLSSLGMALCYDFVLSSGFYKSIPLGPRIPILAFMFCLPPALLFSLLTPLTIKLILPDVGSAGRIAGLVFSLSTLGCLVGNYFTGFWLIAYLTLNEIAMGVGVGLIALAIPIFFIKRPNGANLPPPREEAKAADTSETAAGGWDFKNNIRLAYAIVFIASFCGMSLELTGARLSAPYVGVSLYTWTGIIGVMLAGTAVGNYLGGVLADRGVGPALRRFSIILAILAGAAVGPIVARQLMNDKYNPNDRQAIDHLVRCAGAVLGALVVLPGLRLCRSKGGSNFLTALVGGLLGAVLIHAIGFHQSWVFAVIENRLNEGVGVETAWWLIHGFGVVAGATLALLFARDAPKEGERTTRIGALMGTLFLGGVMVLCVLLMTVIFSNTTVMTKQSDIVLKVLAWTFGMFFLPMLLLGTISPQVIRLSVPDLKSAGRVAGSIYAWSTTGAIVGTFATGYFLISSVGTLRVLLILAFVLTLTAFFVGQLWKNNVMIYAASIICGGAIFGLYAVNFGSNRFDLETKYYAISVTASEDGINASRNGKGDYRLLTLDHLLHSSVKLDDPTFLHYKHEFVQAELLLLARSPGAEPNLLVIGGGGYTFPRYVEVLMPDVRVEVVEIDPGVTQIAHRKLGLPSDTKIRTHHMDGRQFVSERAPKGYYQLVVQDAVNDLSVPGHLMTKEYNDAVKATLAPDGVYLLTLIDSLRDGKLWRAAVHTMRKSFKYVYVLGPGPEDIEVQAVVPSQNVYVLYGSDRPLDLDAVYAAAYDYRRELMTDAPAIALVAPQVPYVVAELSPWLAPYIRVLSDKTLDAILKKVTKEDGSTTEFKEIVLTDQSCPVDNLMSEVFRRREREPH